MSSDRYQFVVLEITTPGGVVMHRWHSRHGWRDVSWDGATWSFQPFEHGGISAGAVVEAATCALSLPRLPTLERIMRQAHREGWRGWLRVYHWDSGDEIGTAPPPEALLMGVFRGVFSLAGLTLTTMAANLDSSLLAGQGGGQFPPRVASTMMIGTPVVLKGGG